MQRRDFITKAVAAAAGLAGGAAAAAAATPEHTPGCGCGSPPPAGPGGSVGYGRCFRSGCNCRAFEGYGYTCSNCGHNYDAHG